MVTVELPSAAEIDTFDAVQVDEGLFRIEQAARRVEAARAATIARGEALAASGPKSGYRASGFTSTRAWVTANANTSTRVAGGQVSLARAVMALPRLAAALATGQCGIEQALLIARLHSQDRFRSHVEQMEDFLVRAAVELPLPHFRLVLARFQSAADPDGRDVSIDDAHRRRTAGSFSTHGVWELRARAGAVDGEEFDRIWRHFTDREFDADWAAAKAIHGENLTAALLARTPRQRRMDALMAMAHAARSATPALASEPSVTIIADAATTLDTLIAAAGLPTPPVDPATFTDRMAETLGGQPISRSQLLAALFTGRLQVMFRQPGTRRVELGRQQRFFTAAMRHALQILDRTCVHPACEKPADQSETDHVEPYSDGGTTGVSNGALECGTHNRSKHELGLTLQWHNGHWHWFDSEGIPVTPTTRPDPSMLAAEPEAAATEQRAAPEASQDERGPPSAA